MPLTHIRLYPWDSRQKPDILEKFTFHYASTLSDNFLDLALLAFSNLHSTMLLLYRVSPLYSMLTFLHLHSTMLLLYPGSLTSLAMQRLKNLHSTMLLLYLRLRAFISSLCFIYIPLCFYFILYNEMEPKELDVNLHSTMLLLYRHRENNYYS